MKFLNICIFVIFLLALVIAPVIADETKTNQTGSGSTISQDTGSQENETVESHKLRADEYINAGEYDKAVEEYGKAIELDPENPELYFERGIALRKARKWEEGINDFKKAIEIDSKFDKAYRELGQMYRTMGEFELSLENYNKYIELKPDDAKGYAGRGLLYYYNDEYEEAIKSFEKALQIEPDFSLIDRYKSLSKVNMGISEPAVDFKLKDVDGNEISLSEFKGKKSVIIDQWASWCGPCRQELPELSAFYEKYSNDLEIIAASKDKELKPAVDFVKEKKISVRIIHDPEGKINELYPCDYIPFLVVVNKDGNIIKTFIGYDEKLIEKLEEILGLKQVKSKRLNRSPDRYRK